MDNNLRIEADLLWVNTYKYDDRSDIRPHAHIGFYHLFYVEDGQVEVTVMDQTYTLAGGQIMLAAPDVLHSMRGTIKEAPVKELKFIVYSAALDDALQKLSPVITIGEMEKTIIEELIHIGSEGGGIPMSTIRRYYLGSLLQYLSRDVLAPKPDPGLKSKLPACLEGFDTSRFSKATIKTAEYIEKNFMNDISLSSMGEETGYFKNYISTVVKKDLNINVNTLLTFVRVKKAAELLCYSNYTIKEICDRTGFKNVNHFTRIFKNTVGIPPAHYRRSFPESIAKDYNTTIPIWTDKKVFDYVKELQESEESK